MTSRSGGSLVDHAVTFTVDSKYLLVCSGTVVKVFCCATSAQLRVLEGHTDEVTAVAHSADNVLQAVSASLDGRIIVWDLDDAIALRCFAVGLPIAAMAVNPADARSAFLLTSEGAEPAGTPSYASTLTKPGRVYHVSLAVSKKAAKRGRAAAASSGKRAAGGAGGVDATEGAVGSAGLPWPVEVKSMLFRVKAAGARLAVGTCGEATPVVAVASGRWLTAHDVASGATRHFHQTRPMECIALSPTELLAATGDDSGRVHLWRLSGLSDAGALAGPAREMHWHAQRVPGITFSADGAYVYSAGREAVLVLWRTHGVERDFLPRLGAPILGIAVAADGGTLALRSADNAIRLVDIAARAVGVVVHGLRRAAAMVADPRLRCLVMHGGAASGTLQWWAPQRDTQLLALEVSPTNLSGSLPALSSRQSDHRRRSYRDTAAAGGTAAVAVTHAALSADGFQLATYERRAAAELRQHTCLKFWSLHDGEWQLTTRVPQPHAADASALAFHPELLLALTAAADAKFKLWEGVAPATVDQPADGAAAAAATPLRAGTELAGWACRAVGYYRQSAASAAAFSADGSLLAVAYAPDVITLWEPLTNLLLGTLVQPLPDPSDALCFVAFPADGATLLAHSRRALFCWDLLSSHLLWAYRATEVFAAAADPYSDAALFAVAMETAAAGGLRQQAHAVLEFASNATAIGAPPAVGEDGAAASQGGVPRRAWRLAQGPPRALGFLPTTVGGSGGGTALCLSADDELFALAAPSGGGDEGRAAAPADGAARPSLRQVAPTALDAIFGAPARNTEREASADRVASLGDIGTGVGGNGDRSPGWEARAMDAWIERNVANVPSHLLPPPEALHTHLMHEVLLPAPHLVPGGNARYEVEGAVAAATGESGAAALAAAVEEWAPALRRGFLASGKHGPQQAQAAAAEAGAMELDGAAGAADPEAGASAAEANLAGAMPEGWLLSAAGGQRALSNASPSAADSEADSDQKGTGDAPMPRGGDAKASRPGGGGRSNTDRHGEQQAHGPPAGRAALDLCGATNPGLYVRDVQLDQLSQWDGTGAAPTNLSAADKAFWEEHAMSEVEVERTAEWMAEQCVFSTGDGNADAEFAAASASGNYPPPPAGLTWEPLETSAAEVWQNALDSGAYGGPRLPGSAGDLQTELREAADFLANAGVLADRQRGHGLEPGLMPDDMRQPLTAGWEHEPTKAELKTLAKAYRQRVAAGDPPEKLAVLGAGLRASSSRAARRAVLGTGE